jgi:lipoprotein-anchoring transpeptidase ErfK/SrfK
MHLNAGKNRRILTILAALIGLLTAALAPLTPTQAQAFNPRACANDNAGKPLSAACEAMIKNFPTPPNLKPITLDGATMSRYSFWRVGPKPTPLFDAPNGSIVGEIPQGFNYVNAIDVSVDGWLRIEGGRWVHRDQARYSEPSTFRGVEINDGLVYEFAWVLDKSFIYTSEYPGGPASKNTGRFLKRYEVVNIFAVATDSEGWRWYMIGPNHWVKQTFVAKVFKIKRPDGVRGRWVAIDLYEQTIVAYQDDKPVFATLIASGTPPTETKEGLYAVWASMERDGMSGATGAPDAYALQSVPWVMYFDGSYSIHGTYWHDLFGYRQSHGCVNLTISDARYVYQWFKGATPDQDGKLVNQVYVHSSGVYGGGVLRQ